MPLCNLSETSQLDTRPEIESIRSYQALQRWYWLKSELVTYAKQRGIGTACQKPELVRRIGHWLETGEAIKNSAKRATSSFDWRTETLSEETVITDSYRNTKNVRAFMKRYASDRFKFSNEFMQWMRLNQGKTLGDAAQYWIELDRRKREAGYRETALPHNQYNQFTRAISQARPGISAKEIRRIWAVKRREPGPHIYKEGDENK